MRVHRENLSYTICIEPNSAMSRVRCGVSDSLVNGNHRVLFLPQIGLRYFFLSSDILGSSRLR